MTPSIYTRSWKCFSSFFLIIIVWISLFSQHALSHTIRQKGEKLSLKKTPVIGEKVKRQAPQTLPSPKIAFDPTSIFALFGNAVPTPERKQRFCLNRLRDALQLVCSSGSLDQMPHYFNPNHYMVNDSSEVTTGQARNLRNEIPTLVQPLGRQILRRRSRRTIVRECCDRPCSYSDMKKYCSPSLSFPDDDSFTIFDENQPMYGLSRLPPKLPSQQCVTVAELQSYYHKFFRKQWKKDGYQHGQIHEPEQSYNRENDGFSLKDFLFKGQANQLKETTSKHEDESRDENEINEMTENIIGSSKKDRNGNVRTAPPINRMVSIPRGTNDYIY